MSTASALLATGFAVNLRIHGETLGYIPASAVVRNDNGEVVTDETGQAVLSDDAGTEFTGIFDEAYVMASPAGAEFSTTTPAAVVDEADLPGITRGAIITRASTSYFVMLVQPAEQDGSQVIILSKQAH